MKLDVSKGFVRVTPRYPPTGNSISDSRFHIACKISQVCLCSNVATANVGRGSMQHSDDWRLHASPDLVILPTTPSSGHSTAVCPTGIQHQQSEVIESMSTQATQEQGKGGAQIDITCPPFQIHTSEHETLQRSLLESGRDHLVGVYAKDQCINILLSEPTTMAQNGATRAQGTVDVLPSAQLLWAAALSSETPDLLLAIMSSSSITLTCHQIVTATTRLADLCRLQQPVPVRPLGVLSSPSTQRTSSSHPQRGYDSLMSPQKEQYKVFLRNLCKLIAFKCEQRPGPVQSTAELQQAHQGRTVHLLGVHETLQLLCSLAWMGKRCSTLVDLLLKAVATDELKTDAARFRTANSSKRYPGSQLSTSHRRQHATPSSSSSSPGIISWLQLLSNQQVLDLCWALAKLQYRPTDPTVVPELYTRTLPLLRSLSFSRASALAWSLARLRQPAVKAHVPDSHWWTTLETATLLSSTDGHWSTCGQQGHATSVLHAEAVESSCRYTVAGIACTTVGRTRSCITDPPTNSTHRGSLLRNDNGLLSGLHNAVGMKHQKRMRSSSSQAPPSPGQVATLIWAAAQLNPHPRPSSTWIHNLLLRLDPNLKTLRPRERYLLMSGLAVLKYKLPENWPASLLCLGLPKKLGTLMQPHISNRTRVASSGTPTVSTWLEAGCGHGGTLVPKHSRPSAERTQQAIVEVRGQRLPFTSLDSLMSVLPHAGPFPCEGGEAPSSANKHGYSPTAYNSMICKPNAGEYSSMLTALAALRMTLNQAELEEVAKTAQAQFWCMSPRLLTSIAATLQSLGFTPSWQWQMEWMEECNLKIKDFDSLQLLKYGQVLNGWGVKLNHYRSHTFVSAVAQWMEHCSRSRLVQLLKIMVLLGIRVNDLWISEGGSRWKDQPPFLEGSVAVQESNVSPISLQTDRPSSHRMHTHDVPLKEKEPSVTVGGTTLTDAWLCAFLKCFLSRNFRQPLPRHQSDLTMALSTLCQPLVHSAVKAQLRVSPLSPAAEQLLRQALMIPEGWKPNLTNTPPNHWLHFIPANNRLSVITALEQMFFLPC
ncbi:hypothetical protein CEUSTIGMA_g7065.t1 [Chlamydomonas eustigma]|uniref:Uncharacterized protein n=1 Tax=Chlamydomonas eustigma TaxID=1157962 RepID=A0A250X968_9CHLO|nr:hypothetical protein CEUSTIGMA_g7065.t1 [Chlamydomonas eustigma]|eukprot:GAX79624.1 hypothetical protein CEUSTIGMA_g7065.t1 [Chlamydomonas eustigma]